MQSPLQKESTTCYQHKYINKTLCMQHKVSPSHKSELTMWHHKQSWLKLVIRTVAHVWRWQKGIIKHKLFSGHSTCMRFWFPQINPGWETRLSMAVRGQVVLFGKLDTNIKINLLILRFFFGIMGIPNLLIKGLCELFKIINLLNVLICLK